MSGRAASETSLRDLGDRKHVVVYTRERTLLARLRDWQTCRRIQTYEIWPDATPFHARVIAWDLYFPVSERRRLEIEVRPDDPPVHPVRSTPPRSSGGIPSRRATGAEKGRVAGKAPSAPTKSAKAKGTRKKQSEPSHKVSPAPSTSRRRAR